MRGLNRIGNMLVPNSNYCKFEDWIMPVLNQMLKEQQELGTNWTPSKVWLSISACFCKQLARMGVIIVNCSKHTPL